MSSTVFDRFCRRLGQGVLLGGVVLSPLVLAEAGARLFYEPPPIRQVYDPFAYRIPQPGLVESFDGLEGRRVDVRLNELGMRGPSIAELSADGLTLVFLGGSTTENYAYPREETFPELVGVELSRRLGRPVRVLNAGMAAATTSGSLSRLQHQVLDLEPSLVIVMHAINDFLSGFHPEFHPGGRHLRRPAVAGTLPRSYFWDWLRRRPSKTYPELSPERRRVEDFRSFPAFRVFERNLDSMAAVAAAHGVPILFLSQATMFREEPLPGDEERLHMMRRWLGGLEEPPDVPSLARGMRAFNDAVLSRPSAFGGQVFDLAGRVPRSFDLIFDDCHLTVAGNRRVASELVPVLEKILREG